MEVTERPFGIRFTDFGKVHVVDFGTPAFKSGITIGSRLIAINGLVINPGTWSDDYAKADLPFKMTFQVEKPDEKLSDSVIIL